ncbi:hypothetical protein [Microcoleus sp. OTE_8_concoct_300]|uniref:hypothetical protein n=1 Tax=Microcoleus sp. OTE_8_concoct_300 TaxID=2964710 RepID=UPI00403FAA16
MSPLPSLMQVVVPDADVNPIALIAFDRQAILDFRFWILDWGLKKPGFLRLMRAVTKVSGKKIRFLTTRA